MKLWDRLTFPERKKCPLAKYQPEISPYNVYTLEKRVVMRIEFMTREDESIIDILTNSPTASIEKVHV